MTDKEQTEERFEMILPDRVIVAKNPLYGVAYYIDKQYLYNAGYRKVADNTITISEDTYRTLKKRQSENKRLRGKIGKLKIEIRKETAKEIIDEIKVIKDKAQNLPKNLTADKFIYFLNILMEKIAYKYDIGGQNEISG